MAIFVEQDVCTFPNSSAFTNYFSHLSDLLLDLSPQDIAQIERFFVRNLGCGRAQRVRNRWMMMAEACDPVSANAPSLVGDSVPMDWQLFYLRQIVQIFRQERTLLYGLANGDDDIWYRLYLRLADSACHLLVRKGLDPHQALDMAPDMAQQTCYRIYMSVFPCDVAFTLWAHLILKNHIRHRLMRSRDLLDRQRYIESLDYLQGEGGGREIGGSVSQKDPAWRYAPTSYAQQIEDIDWLADAIAQIPSAERRAVIGYTFFQDLSDDEIADRLGKSKGAVHTLRHRALRQLHHILAHEKW